MYLPTRRTPSLRIIFDQNTSGDCVPYHEKTLVISKLLTRCKGVVRYVVRLHVTYIYQILGTDEIDI